MFSWPQLPSISLPATIQRRFVSFILRRSLGHLVRPGQLDPAQIDAQIGSGFVEVNDVQLDNDIINRHLTNLPLPLQLESGSIDKISVRIPWPNPFSAPFALSLSSLCLTFIILPRSESGGLYVHAADELAESVASVAESFIHDELSELDNQSLRESFHLDSHSQRQPPGAIDPFLSTEDLDAGRSAHGYAEDEEDDTAPSTQGVSLLAILIERLLAKFEFDASGTTLRFVLPQKAEFVVRLGNLVYNTVIPQEDSDSQAERSKEDGESRTIKTSEFAVYVRDLTPSPLATSTANRRPPSRLGSSSEEEDESEEVMMMMSQSLASLPPLPSPGSISPGSSMYHSATSSVRDSSPDPTAATIGRESVEEKILSLGTGSEPVVLTLVTPPLAPKVQLEVYQGSPNTMPRFQPISMDNIRLTLSAGPVAVALNPTQTLSIYNLSSALARSRPLSPEPRPQPQTRSPNLFDFSMHVKSFTLLLLQPPSSPVSKQGSPKDPLQFFFSTRSVPPPSPRIPHLRIQLDAIKISRNTVLDAATAPSRGITISSPASASHSAATNLVKASLDDISVFAFFSHVQGTAEGWTASPVLVSDTNLGSQYEPNDGRFPMFDVTDWRNGGAAKVSQWRLRSLHPKRKSSTGIPSPAPSPRIAHLPVIRACIDLAAVGPNAMCEVDVVPLHLFVDVALIDGAMGFLRGATPTAEGRYENDRLGKQMEDTPPATPKAKKVARWDKDERVQRERAENLLMDLTGGGDDSSTASLAGLNFVLRFSLVRVQVRAPPPAVWASGQRSGALVMDIHGLQIMPQEKESTPQRRTAQFKSNATKAGPKVLSMVEFKAFFMALALPGDTTATTFLSIVPLPLSPPETSPPAFGASPPDPIDPTSSMSLPSVCLRSNPVLPSRPSVSASPGAASSLSVDAQLPSVHAAISKPAFEGLAFLADDIAQRFFGDVELFAASDASGRSRDPSIIGSRFFAMKNSSAGSSESGAEGRKSEMIVKVSVVETQISLLVPRKGDGGKARSLEITASEFDFLAEIKPEGKDETVVTIGVMDLNIMNTPIAGDPVAIMGLTIPRFVNPSSKPLLKLRFISVVDNETVAKESRVKVTASGFTYLFTPEYDWLVDLGLFLRTPEGAFDSVVPSERTKVAIKVTNSSFRFLGPEVSGALVAYVGELDWSTSLVGDSPEMLINTAVTCARFFFIDDVETSPAPSEPHTITQHDADLWKYAGYALLAELDDFEMRLLLRIQPSVNAQVHIDGMKLKLHACADTLFSVGLFVNDFGSIFRDPDEKPSLPERPAPTTRNPHSRQRRDVLASVDENTFRRIPDLGPAPDMIRDDLPTNLDYLDASFGTAAGLRELRDEDLFELELEQNEMDSGRGTPTPAPGAEGIIANFGGETIRMLDPHGIRVVEGHFENIPPEAVDSTFGVGENKLNLRIRNCDLTVSLYDGYDWVRTRKAIEDEVKAMRRRLIKIRQLLASGQVPDDSIEETSAILFNSVHIGLIQGPEELEPGALIAAIDEELKDDGETETGSQSSWQSFKRKSPHKTPRATRVRGKKLTRSKSSQIDFCLTGVQAEIDQYNSGAPLVSKMLVTIRDLEILDHIKTSTWKTFLTELRTDFRGNVRETASDMVRAELRIVHPAPELPTEEGRLRAKLLPIKLHVDQDALDFMKKFFSFQSPDSAAIQTSPETELYFQHVEVFPVDIKLDYKPKRVDYKALREGRTIELMNFFHFDGAEITLRHITLSGIAGWSRLFETLNDLWTPDVKTNQLADIISGVSPVRSLVNVGTGVADLVLLPIAQYKKDKRVVRGVQKGTTAFVKSTAMEAIKLGARLATGTQVILERAETVLGSQGQFRETVTAETLQTPVLVHSDGGDDEAETADISKYADQPVDVRDGMQTAYRSLAKNFNSAAQTILAVPMEVYERSGSEGPVRAVVRAVPVAVLKPMIGASEAVSKTLFGLRNTMDPEVRHENEAKYKQR